jgi:L-lysine 2,3-aminomutase
MDFDHVDGTKVMMVSQLAIRGATRKLMVEMAKCEVVCSNCHRLRTWARAQYDPTATDELPVAAPIDEQLRLLLDAG